MAYDNKNFGDNNRNNESIFSKRIRAGKRRTYFFDVRTTRANDYFITITESKKRFDDNGYDRHKIFLYKEDFNKFVAALEETVGHVKTDLMPDFDFDAFNHDQNDENGYDDSDSNSNHSSSSSSSYSSSESTSGTERVAASAASEPVTSETSAVPSGNDDSSVEDWKL